MYVVMDSNSESSFLRARQLLRTEGALSKAEFEELVAVLDEVNGTQFLALTSDPEHQRVLRLVDRYSRRQIGPILTVMVVLFFLSVAIGISLAL